MTTEKMNQGYAPAIGYAIHQTRLNSLADQVMKGFPQRAGYVLAQELARLSFPQTHKASREGASHVEASRVKRPAMVLTWRHPTRDISCRGISIEASHAERLAKVLTQRRPPITDQLASDEVGLWWTMVTSPSLLEVPGDLMPKRVRAARPFSSGNWSLNGPHLRL
ncbi:hypothetical protein AgCh_014068 [Apium graveolens]